MSSEHTPVQGPITVTTDTGQAPIVTTDNQPVVTSPIVDGGTPAPVVTPVASPDPAISPAETTPVATTDTNKNNTSPDWAVKRINELTAKRYEAERKAAAETTARLAAEKTAADLLAKFGSAPNADPNANAPKPVLTEDEIERRAVEKAQQIAEANRFNEICNNVAETGKKEYADWDIALKNLSLVGAIGQNVSPEFLQTAVELKDPHKILHYLGSNLEEAERVTKLAPKKMAMELARLEASLNAPPAPVPIPAPVPVSQAPAPVIPVGGKASPASVDITDPNISMEDFYKIRAQQEEAKRNRYRRA